MALASIAAPRAGAEDAPAKTWKNETQLTFLSARGNSNSRTLGAGEKFETTWGRVGLNVGANALNVESDGDRTSERYDASEKVQWNWTDRNYVFERFLWESNRFSGFRHRYDGSVGLGRELLKTKADQLFLELGGGYINEQRILPPREDFGSGRGYAKYLRSFSDTSKFSQDGEYLHNFDNPNGYRVNTETVLTAGINSHVSLKLSYAWKHVHEPPEGFKRDDTTTLVSILVNY